MSAKSSSTAYGTVAVLIHWLSVCLIVVLLGSGFRAGQTEDLATKALFLKFHAPLGITILLLTLARLVWWWRFDTKPDPLGGDPAWQERIAKLVHFALYVVILGMAVSGISMFVLSGAGEILFGGGTGPLPDFSQFLPRVPHGIGARVFIGLLILHAGAALFHHFIRRDKTLRRMWFQ